MSPEGARSFRPYRARIPWWSPTQGCAPSSLPLGFYIAGPSALRGIGGFALDFEYRAGLPPYAQTTTTNYADDI